MYSADELYDESITSPLARPQAARSPLYVTVESDGARAIITAHGPSYVTNSQTVAPASVAAIIDSMRRTLSGRDIIVKEFAQ